MSQLASQPAATVPTAQPVILEARGVARSFRMGESVVQVLKDCDLAVRAGEFIAIEGRSGSGKSTLLHVMGALDIADRGKVLFEGQDYTRRLPEQAAVLRFLTGMTMFRLWLGLLLATPAMILAWWVRHNMALDSRPMLVTAIICGVLLVLVTLGYFIPKLINWATEAPEERRAARMRNEDFGFVFQFYHLLPELDVMENVLITSMVQHSWLGYMARRRELRERAKQILTELGMGHRLTHRPQQLSGGERQRVAIARALMNRPRVLFADEPTGNLDYETGRQIMGVLEQLHREQKQTIIMVTHDRALARQADRVLVLKAGRLEKAE
jgi:ABC-type lipoprotein export system ATPase subunit